MRRRTRASQPRDSETLFVAGVLGAVGASLLWLVVVLALSMSPEDAQDRRTQAALPPPSVAVRRTVLREVSWYACSRMRSTVTVLAPAVPRGYRPVVTALAESGRKVRTGTRLAGVSGQPLIALTSREVFYRDLVAGDRGEDVAAFEKALRAAGVLVHAGGALDAVSLAAWHRRFDPGGPLDRVQVDRLVTVPPGASVAEVLTSPGRLVKVGAPLLRVGARARDFRCDVPDPEGDLRRTNAQLLVAGHRVGVAELTVQGRTSRTPGSVRIRPEGLLRSDRARLGISSAGTDGPVLAVPLSAIKTDAAGEQVVDVVGGPADGRLIPVDVGVSANGLVEITGRGLRAGVQVRLFGAVATHGNASPR